MPDGIVLWFDKTSGEGCIVHGGRRYHVVSSDMDHASGTPGARVHFDIDRHGHPEGSESDVPVARSVELRTGTRVQKRQHHFGSQGGAHDAAQVGHSPFAAPHAELRHDLVTRPLDVGREWIRWMGERDFASALLLYAPEAELHVPGRTLTGREAMVGALEDCNFAGSAGHRAQVSADKGVVVARLVAPDALSTTWLRVGHGLIVEQWLGGVEPVGPAGNVETERSAPFVQVSSRGDVAASDEHYGRQRLIATLDLIDEPILFARVKLTHFGDPAVPKGARAEAAVDINGDVLRASATAFSMREAIDLLERRLRDRLGHRGDREQRRPAAMPAEPGEWSHGNLPTPHVPGFDRPIDEREIMRRKPVEDEEVTVEEAAWDMHQLDYDFYLFHELGSGVDSMLERTPDGLVLTLLEPRPDDVALGVVKATVATAPAPRLSVTDAVERLNSSGEQHLLFAEADSGRGAVLYRRYDGHYALLGPLAPPRLPGHIGSNQTQQTEQTVQTEHAEPRR